MEACSPDDIGCFLLSIIQNPSPWLSAIFGASLTGGVFGWVAHGRSVRPVLVFVRDHETPSPRWQIQNVGQGVAFNIRVRDYKGTEATQKVHCYPLSPGKPHSIEWVASGDRLEADYTDAYGRRMYLSIGENNTTIYKRRYLKLPFFRPSRHYLDGYAPEIHQLRLHKSAFSKFQSPTL